MLTSDLLKSYLREMPRGHVFDLRYDLFATVFPPGAGARAAWDALEVLAETCDIEVKDFANE